MNIDTFKEYQEEAQRTRTFNDTELANYTLGLVCEAGELGDYVKKHLFHGHDLDVDNVKKELGDVLWYLSNISSLLNIDLDDVATSNIDKLKTRYPDGFSKKDSIKRVDV